MIVWPWTLCRRANRQIEAMRTWWFALGGRASIRIGAHYTRAKGWHAVRDWAGVDAEYRAAARIMQEIGQ